MGLINPYMDAAPQFIKFTFQGAGEFMHSGGRLGDVQGDESFAWKEPRDFAAHIGRITVGFEDIQLVDRIFLIHFGIELIHCLDYANADYQKQ